MIATIHQAVWRKGGRGMRRVSNESQQYRCDPAAAARAIRHQRPTPMSDAQETRMSTFSSNATNRIDSSRLPVARIWMTKPVP